MELHAFELSMGNMERTKSSRKKKLLMSTINGLLTQKPTSPVPNCGEQHRYSIEQRTSQKTGKPWTKVKAEGEGYGKLYEVVGVEKTNFVDAHGNVSFNITLVELSGGDSAVLTENDKITGQAPKVAPPAQPTVTSTSTNSKTALHDFWDTYRYNFLRAGGLHEELLPTEVVEKMSEYEFARINQVAAISATIEHYKSKGRG
jgi:hypothetical protein